MAQTQVNEASQARNTVITASPSTTSSLANAAGAGLNLIRATGGSGGITLTLPAVASSSGARFLVKKVDSGAGAVTLAGNGAENIDGSNTLSLAAQFSYIQVFCNGTSWDVVASSAATSGGSVASVAGRTGAVTLDTTDISGFVDEETPAGTVNGSNTSFTLAHAPNPAGSLKLYLDGIRLKAGGADYSLSTLTITYTVAPGSGAVHICDYRY